MDVEAASKSIDELIDRRSRDGANADEELWKASERRHREEQQREHAAAWFDFHHAQAERLERTARELALEHRARAEELCDAPDA